MTRTAEEIRAHIRVTRGQTGSLFFRDFWHVLASDLPKSAKLTRLALLGFSDATGEALGEAFPSLNTLAVLTGQGESGVRRDTSLLTARGWLQKRRRGGHLTSTYAPRIPMQTLNELSDALTGGTSDRSPVGSLDRSPVDSLDRSRVTPNRHSGSAQSIGTEERDSPAEPADSSVVKSHAQKSRPSARDHSEERIRNAQKLALRLKSSDDNRIFSGELFTDGAYALLADLIDKHGEHAIEQAGNHLIGRDRSGSPMRRGHVRRWSYLERAISDEGAQHHAI